MNYTDWVSRSYDPDMQMGVRWRNTGERLKVWMEKRKGMGSTFVVSLTSHHGTASRAQAGQRLSEAESVCMSWEKQVVIFKMTVKESSQYLIWYWHKDRHAATVLELGIQNKLWWTDFQRGCQKFKWVKNNLFNPWYWGHWISIYRRIKSDLYFVANIQSQLNM